MYRVGLMYGSAHAASTLAKAVHDVPNVAVQVLLADAPLALSAPLDLLITDRLPEADLPLDHARTDHCAAVLILPGADATDPRTHGADAEVDVASAGAAVTSTSASAQARSAPARPGDRALGGTELAAVVQAAVLQAAVAAASPDPGHLDASQALSGRERQVLGCIANGFTHHQTARKLGISPHTVDTYIKRIRGKLGVGNKAELTRAAVGYR
ncbi:MAG TPA: helix-turn-helix transcriptional regulator [Pilimelia sp.]|nr:helix-turn-helix transcriptional regulator [Pilimelia sp.]